MEAYLEKFQCDLHEVPVSSLEGSIILSDQEFSVTQCPRKKMVNIVENVIDFLSSQVAPLIFERCVSNFKNQFMIRSPFSHIFFRFFCVLVSEKKIVRFMKNEMDFLSSQIAPLFSELFVRQLKSYFLNDFSEIYRAMLWYPDLSPRISRFFCVLVSKKKIVRFMKNEMDFLSSQIAPLISELFV